MKKYSVLIVPGEKNTFKCYGDEFFLDDESDYDEKHLSTFYFFMDYWDEIRIIFNKDYLH